MDVPSNAPADLCPQCLLELGFGFGPGFISVAPELILHYMDAHAYQPPPEFCQAVLACPPVPSTAYLEDVAANGGGILLAPGS